MASGNHGNMAIVVTMVTWLTHVFGSCAAPEYSSGSLFEVELLPAPAEEEW